MRFCFSLFYLYFYMLPLVAGTFYVFDHYTIRRALCLRDSDETPRLLVRQVRFSSFDWFCHTDFTKYTWLKILSSVTLEYGTHESNSRRSNAWFYVSVFLRLWKSFQNCLGSDTKRFKSLREYNMTLTCSFFIILRLILKLILKTLLQSG